MKETYLTKLIKEYIINKHDYTNDEKIKIDYINFNGSVCSVEWSYRNHYHENDLISIWEVIEFIEEKRSNNGN